LFASYRDARRARWAFMDSRNCDDGGRGWG
jgi:hypothetical protein